MFQIAGEQLARELHVVWYVFVLIAWGEALVVAEALPAIHFFFLPVVPRQQGQVFVARLLHVSFRQAIV